MMRRPDRRLILLALVLLISMMPRPGASQATPVPPECGVPARKWEDVSLLVATPAPPEPERTGTLPWGEQVSAEQLAAIRATVEQFIACSNAGEPLRVFALYTDAYLQRLLNRERPVINRDRYDALATPVPVNAGSGAVLREITGARTIVMTGQLGALVTITYPSVPEPKTFFFTFSQVDGELRIDDILGELTFSLP
jgi:hypothetical protein